MTFLGGLFTDFSRTFVEFCHKGIIFNIPIGKGGVVGEP